MRWLATVLIWWFAVIAPSGETIFIEYRYKDDCVFQQKVYSRVIGLKVTTCQEKARVDARRDIG